MTAELRLKINGAFQDESDELVSLDEKIISWRKILKEEWKQLDNRRKLETADNRTWPRPHNLSQIHLHLWFKRLTATSVPSERRSESILRSSRRLRITRTSTPGGSMTAGGEEGTMSRPWGLSDLKRVINVGYFILLSFWK